MLFCAFCFLSCEEDSMMTSGQWMISEIQSVISEQNVTELQIRAPIVHNNYPGGTTNFSFRGETIQINDEYYNVNRVISYYVRTYTKEVNGNSRDVNYMVIIMDLGIS